jgi:tRNA nucleotidyltransferase/poly(A) polymerase
MDTQLNFAKHISETLHNNHFECFAVGGFVRDNLMGRTPHDIDLTTNAVPSVVAELFKDECKIIDVGGEKFGTLVLHSHYFNVDLEITTFRKDVKCDGRKAVVEFSSSLEDDLGRRDFTINAIAVDLSTGKLIDPFNGQTDILNNVVRAVGDPVIRFQEDFLRMLRACRFTALNPNMFIVDSTAVAINQFANNIVTISCERIRTEFLKAMEYPVPSNMFRSMLKLGLLEILLPELYATVGVEQNLYHSVYQCKDCGLFYTVKQCNDGVSLTSWPFNLMEE